MFIRFLCAVSARTGNFGRWRAANIVAAKAARGSRRPWDVLALTFAGLVVAAANPEIVEAAKAAAQK
jgi:hypothetical protein